MESSPLHNDTQLKHQFPWVEYKVPTLHLRKKKNDFNIFLSVYTFLEPADAYLIIFSLISYILKIHTFF